jgi:hypothetical protein
MTRALRLFVLVAQIAAWGLGTAGFCLCSDTAKVDAGGCCEGVLRSGQDCCAPARDQLTAAPHGVFEHATALEMPAHVAFMRRGVALDHTFFARAVPTPAPPRPAFVLRI